ncbi:hypothetical protein ERO13_D04G002850v2 [Gossypium hirsutum]|nr:hypothetical protein ERO13_D04G002850v2 [Gossypium hirsutum]
MWFLFLEFGASLCPLPVLLSIYPDGFHLQVALFMEITPIASHPSPCNHLQGPASWNQVSILDPKVCLTFFETDYISAEIGG